MKNFMARCRGLWYTFKYQHLLRRAVMQGAFYAHSKLVIKGRGKVFFGSNVGIFPTAFGGDFVTLYLNHPESVIRIGKNVLLRGTRVGCESNIDIGDEAVIESASLFDTDFHHIDASRRDEMDEKAVKPLVIGAGSYVGWECCIGKGVSLGERSIVLPNTLLTWKTTGPEAVLLGVPGRVL